MNGLKFRSDIASTVALAFAAMFAVAGDFGTGLVAAQQPSRAPVTRSYDSLTQATPAKPLTVDRPLITRLRSGGLLVLHPTGVFLGDDGGSAWTRRGAVPVENGADAAVSLATLESGAVRCLTRSGHVFETVDSGQSWTLLSDLAVIATGKAGARVVAGRVEGDGSGWAFVKVTSNAATSTRVFVSSDGKTWTPGCDVRGVVQAANRTAAALYAISGSDVFRISLDGLSCERISSLQGAQLNGLAFIDATHGWIGADQGLMIETRDGGKSWLPRPVAPGTVVETLGFLDSGGWAIASAGPLGVVLMTRDGGITWKRVMTGAPPISALTLDGTGWAWLVDGAGEVWAASTTTWDWRRLGMLPGAGPRGKRPFANGDRGKDAPADTNEARRPDKPDKKSGKSEKKNKDGKSKKPD